MIYYQSKIGSIVDLGVAICDWYFFKGMICLLVGSY